MTDFKPFANDTPSRESARSVAVVLDLADDRLDPLLVAPCGQSTLIERAFACIERVADADVRIVRTGSSEVVASFEKRRPRGVDVVRADDPARQGARVSGCSHLLVLDARHPFLRPATIDEAVRLFKLRFDLTAITSCVRAPLGWWFEQDGDWVEDALGHPLPDTTGTLREAHAFHLLPAWRWGRGARRFSGGRFDPYPFELPAREAFRVQSDFELQLAASWLATRAVTCAA